MIVTRLALFVFLFKSLVYEGAGLIVMEDCMYFALGMVC